MIITRPNFVDSEQSQAKKYIKYLIAVYLPLDGWTYKFTKITEHTSWISCWDNYVRQVGIPCTHRWLQIMKQLIYIKYGMHVFCFTYPVES